MRKAIGNIICLLTGVCIGGGVTYLFMKDRFDKMMNEELEQIKAYYEKDTVDQEKAAQDAIDKDSEVEDVEEAPIVHSINKQRDFERTMQKTEYHTFSKKVENSDVEVEDNVKAPYEISMDEYEDYNGYIKRVVSYYSENNVLYDEENDETIDDIHATVGLDIVERMAEDGDINEIYVRNEHLGTDFMVCLEVSEFNPEDL